jgi:hypothetical protein
VLRFSTGTSDTHDSRGVSDTADEFDGCLDSLVVTPDARLYRAYSTMNAEVFDVEYIGPSVPLADAIPNLKAAEADSETHST